MAKRKLRVGVVGTGAIARDIHLPNWQELREEGRIEIVAVCDLIDERAVGAREKFGAGKSYRSYRKMLREHDFDIIDVCTQNRWHCPVTIAALEAGANVLVEKPIAMNAREAMEMARAAKARGRLLMTAQHMRFEPRHEKLKEVVDRGDLGRIYHASAACMRRRGIPGWGKFHIQKESRGGPLIDIGVHILDAVLWITGFPKPISVSGKVSRMFGDRKDLVNGEWGAPYPLEEFDVEDYATALIRLAGGVTLHLEVSWAANIPDTRAGISILGDKAGVSTNPLGVYGYENGALTSTTFDWLPKQSAHRMEIRHFTECVENGRPVRVKPEESVIVQKIIDAVYESSKKNREVAIR
ncbi:MAG TPA: Gfo/Idh/MocA family oxidoreductase [Sumerlaeia bacterium]|nr:Gfo/Idh/MocA family oxidoreductase [Sumerlaeia bacterium]